MSPGAKMSSPDLGGDLSPGTEMSPPDLPGDMWTVDDAIRVLGITRRTVLRKLRNGELTGHKVPGPFGPEWRLYPYIGGGDRPSDLSPVTRSPGVDHQVTDFDHRVTAILSTDLTDELRKQIADLKAENVALQKDLQGANWRNGYLESQTEIKDQQIRLLTDSQHKIGWWAKFSSWFFKA
jgi:excisionase family DNA binding protein